MATVTEIVTRVEQITRTSASNATEAALVLDCVRDAYQQAVADSEILRASTTVNLTNGTASYDLTASPFNITDLMKIRYITVTGDGITARLLERIAESEFLALSQGSIGAPVTRYAIAGTNYIQFWGTPGSGVTATVSYVKTPKTLVLSSPTAGQESTPTAFPSRFHYSILVNLACALVFEYQRRLQEAAFYRTQYDRELAKLFIWAEEFGGKQSPQLFRGYGQVPIRPTAYPDQP